MWRSYNARRSPTRTTHDALALLRALTERPISKTKLWHNFGHYTWAPEFLMVDISTPPACVFFLVRAREPSDRGFLFFGTTPLVSSLIGPVRGYV